MGESPSKQSHFESIVNPCLRLNGNLDASNLELRSLKLLTCKYEGCLKSKSTEKRASDALAAERYRYIIGPIICMHGGGVAGNGGSSCGLEELFLDITDGTSCTGAGELLATFEIAVGLMYS